MGLLIEQMQIRDLVFPEAVVTKGAQENKKQTSKQTKQKPHKPELSFKSLALAMPEAKETAPRGFWCLKPKVLRNFFHVQ